ncbi:MAG: hypothetical protein ACYCX4_00085 [Bacillota bacterium]
MDRKEWEVISEEKALLEYLRGWAQQGQWDRWAERELRKCLETLPLDIQMKF